MSRTTRLDCFEGSFGPTNICTSLDCQSVHWPMQFGVSHLVSCVKCEDISRGAAIPWQGAVNLAPSCMSQEEGRTSAGCAPSPVEEPCMKAVCTIIAANPCAGSVRRPGTGGETWRALFSCSFRRACRRRMRPYLLVVGTSVRSKASQGSRVIRFSSGLTGLATETVTTVSALVDCLVSRLATRSTLRCAVADKFTY